MERSKFTKASKTRYQPDTQKSENEIYRPTLGWSAINNRQVIQAQKNERRSHNPQRWNVVPEVLRKNWYC